MSVSIDLNADLGEGFGTWSKTDDPGLLKIVSSANVACGFHGGDPRTMRSVCQIAAEQGVSIGAHVAYRDLVGFGRRFIDVDPDELTADVLFQLSALEGIARSAGTSVRYIKPHGALYNTIGSHERQARAVVDAITAWGIDVPVLGLPGALWLSHAAEEGLRVVREAFADRSYLPDGTLATRTHPDSILHDPDEISARVARMATDGTVVAIDGSVLDVRPDSVCVHGDSPGAVDVARGVRRGLESAGVTVQPFA